MDFTQISRVIDEMTLWYQGNPKRINHFLKVYAYAKAIGELEGLDEETRFILETTAVLHDIGIKIAEEKYGSGEGPLQEKEGAPAAREMLTALGFPEKVAERAAVLVGRHHTYTNVDGMDCQILLEADFLVNAYEGNKSMDAIRTMDEKVFRTNTGKRFLARLFYKD